MITPNAVRRSLLQVADAHATAFAIEFADRSSRAPAALAETMDTVTF